MLKLEPFGSKICGDSDFQRKYYESKDLQLALKVSEYAKKAEKPKPTSNSAQ